MTWQLNTQPLVPVYKCAIVCSKHKIDMVLEKVKECYENVSIMCWHNKATPTTGTKHKCMFNQFLNKMLKTKH